MVKSVRTDLSPRTVPGLSTAEGPIMQPLPTIAPLMRASASMVVPGQMTEFTIWADSSILQLRPITEFSMRTPLRTVTSESMIDFASMNAADENADVALAL